MSRAVPEVSTPNRPLVTRAVTRGPRHHFFGYYDKSPWDASGRYLLAMAVPFCDRSPGPDDVATLGVVDLVNGTEFTPFAETRAWNWQQGCMLQWLPRAPGRLVIYNDRDRETLVSVVCDPLTGRVERRLPLPIYAVSHDGARALTVNFARLHHQRPGYGYAGVPDPWRARREPEDDGVYHLDLETGQYHLIVPTALAAGMRRKPSMEGSVHRFNHVQFSPDDSRFLVLHRWRPAEPVRRSVPQRIGRGVRAVGELAAPWGEYAGIGARARLRLGLRGLRRLIGPQREGDVVGMTRLLTARPDGTEIAIVADEEMVSHFAWRDPTHILAWARHRGHDGFWLFEVGTGNATLLDPRLRRDGHCSYSPDRERRWILSDAGPDGNDRRSVYLYDTRTGTRAELGSVHSPPELADDFRCDLHPRWSRDGRQICIDSAHEGSRQLYVVDIPWDAIAPVRQWPPS
jgi:hypothetical protein